VRKTLVFKRKYVFRRRELFEILREVKHGEIKTGKLCVSVHVYEYA
jgi:hypothetical protein